MEVTNIYLSKIVRNENQPRKHFDEDGIEELSRSIKSDGLMQPITVRKVSRDTFEIVQGERRYRAAKLAGLTEIPAFVRDIDDEEAFHLAVIENIQREQLTPIEEAQAFQKYIEMGYTHAEIAEKVSKGRTYVTSRLRLLKLSLVIQDWLSEGILADGHAKQLLRLESIMTRLLSNYKGTNNPFECVQSWFYSDYWFDVHKGKKITVKEVKDWGDRLHHSMIRAVASCLNGSPEELSGYSMGYEITAEFYCLMYGLEPSLLVQEDFTFANEYERNYFKKDYNERFRPWMVERYWDEVRTLTDWTPPRDLRLSDMNKEHVEKSLDQITENVKRHLEVLKTAKEELSILTGKTPEDIEEDLFSKVEKSVT